MGDNNYYYDDLNSYSLCPSWAPVLGFGGVVAAVCFASELKEVFITVARVLRKQESILAVELQISHAAME